MNFNKFEELPQNLKELGFIDAYQNFSAEGLLSNLINIGVTEPCCESYADCTFPSTIKTLVFITTGLQIFKVPDTVESIVIMPLVITLYNGKTVNYEYIIKCKNDYMKNLKYMII